MKRQLFGTDGIRGRANQHPMTVEVAMRVGRALGHLVKQGKLGRVVEKGHQGQIVIGKDTRRSGYMLEQAIAAGVTSMGVNVLFLGPLPTPGIAFVCQSMRADAGVVVSASHNSFEDNGIKIFGHDGFKLPDEVELELERLVLTDAIDDVRPEGMDIGRARRIDDAVGRYVVYLKTTFPNEFTLDGKRIVVDCAHGAAYKVAPIVFEELGAEVIKLGVKPDGSNINDGVGSLHPGGVEKKVRELRADLGIALDGDADRVIVVDENGDTIDGDAVMAMCALELHSRGKLKNNTLVTTVMSNIGLDACLADNGIQVERTQVGDRYVVERMRDGDYNLGGENSGHLIFLDSTTTGDGIVAALAILGVMCREQKPLSELAKVFVPVPQTLVNVKVAKKTPLDELDEVKSVISDVEGRLNGKGRVLVRYSGTEMKARVMVEGPDEAAIVADAEKIAAALKDACAA